MLNLFINNQFIYHINVLVILESYAVVIQFDNKITVGFKQNLLF